MLQICDRGYYCPISTTIPIVCGTGKYCPRGSGSELSCPIGTFSFTTGLQNSSECLSCTPGSYCSSLGMTAPSGKCKGGYFCGGGSTSATPNDNGKWPSYGIDVIGEDSCAISLNTTTLNDICPPGHYCSGK